MGRFVEIVGRFDAEDNNGGGSSSSSDKKQPQFSSAG
jgi:hypothetical protein